MRRITPKLIEVAKARGRIERAMATTKCLVIVHDDPDSPNVDGMSFYPFDDVTQAANWGLDKYGEGDWFIASLSDPPIP